MSPQDLADITRTIRDDFSFSFVKGGRHDVKTGGEYVDDRSPIFLCINCGGTLDAQGVANRKQGRSKYGTKKGGAPVKKR